MIEIKIGNLIEYANILNDLISLNENVRPFYGQARALLIHITKEMQQLEGLSEEDWNDISERTLNFGEKIEPPKTFPIPYIKIIEAFCTEVPKFESQVEKILNENKKKQELKERTNGHDIHYSIGANS